MNTVEDVKVINFAGFSEDGLLVPLEDVPFEIKEFSTFLECSRKTQEVNTRITRPVKYCFV